mmetsp:Transcript_67161/g.190474  ORF Transcript_67161/g.190474 Transcript_67161/m.190474 type:complete len:235 (-) Transcript_67161:417-1121(-)
MLWKRALAAAHNVQVPGNRQRRRSERCGALARRARAVAAPALAQLRQRPEGRRQRGGAGARGRAHGQRPGMLDADVEGLGRLPRRGAAALRDLGVDDQGHRPLLRLLKVFLDGKDRCLGVEAVSEALEHQNIDAALHEALDLLVVGLDHVRPLCAGRQRQHAGAGTEDARHEAGLLRLLLGHLRSRPLGQLCRRLVHLVDKLVHLVVFLGERVAAKCVCPHNVGTCQEILLVDL